MYAHSTTPNHRCHLEGVTHGGTRPARSACVCGWLGQWITSRFTSTEDVQRFVTGLQEAAARAFAEVVPA